MIRREFFRCLAGLPLIGWLFGGSATSAETSSWECFDWPDGGAVDSGYDDMPPMLACHPTLGIAGHDLEVGDVVCVSGWVERDGKQVAVLERVETAECPTSTDEIIECLSNPPVNKDLLDAVTSFADLFDKR